MTTGTIEAFKKATNAPETNGKTEVQPAAEPKAKPARAARVTGGAKPAKLRLTSRAKSPKKTNGTTTTKAPAKTKAKTKPTTPVRAKDDFRNDQVITLVKKPEAGWLAERYALLKTGQTVGEGLAGFKGLRRRRESMRSLIEGGFVTVR